VETDRLLLREFTEDDVDVLVALDADPAVRRFLADGRPVPREVTERVTLPRILALYREHPGFGTWAVCTKADNGFVGWVELVPGGSSGVAEVGWRLVRSAWGRGYAVEAARVLVRLAFTELGVSRVVATTMTVNVASRRVMEKLGMSFVRTFFEEWPDYVEGAERGDVEYVLTRERWAGSA
jgi:RimJ/RimL family protein N-acetyltransferase